MNATHSPLNLSRAPFRIAPGADAAGVATEMDECFRTLPSIPARVSACFGAAVACANLHEHSPLLVAGTRIAADIDAGMGAGTGNPYHNTQHFCEVLLGALCLAHFKPLAPNERELLLFAALMHDFHHDGHIVKGVPFRLEKLALEAAAPYLSQAGVSGADRERLAAIVLATFVLTGVPFARACHRHHAHGEPRPELTPDSGALGLLADDARLALLAVLLTEADVLASVGLTVALGDAGQAKIAAEFLASPACREGRVGAEAARVMGA